MKKTLTMLTLLMVSLAGAMPKDNELEKARPVIQELMADDFAALKSGKKTHEAVGDAAMGLIANAETEASKYLLCKAAFGLYLRGKSYDKAADVLATFRKEIPDIPPADLVELVQKSAKGVRGKEAPKLFATYRALQTKATAREEMERSKAALEESPSSASLRRAHAEWCVLAGEWKTALASFAKLEGDFAKAAANESANPAAAADFWWTYEPSVHATTIKDPTLAFKRHAVALYKHSQDDGSLSGLRKNLAEKRIAQFEEETAVPASSVTTATSPRAASKPSLTGLYLVIDLSAGPNATTYPVSSLAAEPSGGWTDEYKTTKLVLRRIKKGTFTMGSPKSEPGRESMLWMNLETQHKVTLLKDFYIGIFPITQRQWQLVIGANPSKFKANIDAQLCPVESISYQSIRGDKLGSAVPIDGRVDSDSFLGILRQRTGISSFDLPSEAQWEYACRAGTASALYNGKLDARLLNKIAWYKDNSEGRTHGVGLKQNNAWGLYDMLGNVSEICRDRVPKGQNDIVKMHGAYGAVQMFPEGVAEVRGGSVSAPEIALRCACKTNYGNLDRKDSRYGFRIIAELP